MDYVVCLRSNWPLTWKTDIIFAYAANDEINFTIGILVNRVQNISRFVLVSFRINNWCKMLLQSRCCSFQIYYFWTSIQITYVLPGKRNLYCIDLVSNEWSHTLNDCLYLQKIDKDCGKNGHRIIKVLRGNFITWLIY